MEENGAVKYKRMMTPPPPQAVNNSRDLHSLWIYPEPAKYMENMQMVMWSHTPVNWWPGTHAHKCVYGCYSSPCKLILAGLDPTSCSNPAPLPIICHHVGCCSLTRWPQMAIQCNTARTGASVPCAKAIITTFHMMLPFFQVLFAKLSVSSWGRLYTTGLNVFCTKTFNSQCTAAVRSKNQCKMFQRWPAKVFRVWRNNSQTFCIGEKKKSTCSSSFCETILTAWDIYLSCMVSPWCSLT